MPSAWQKLAQQRHASAPAQRGDDVAMPDDPKRIWRDPDLLWRWTIDALLATDASPLTDERAAVLMGQQQRRELLQLAQDDPVAFAAYLDCHPEPWRSGLQHLLRRRPPGRRQGHKPGLSEAWDTVQSIRQLWQQRFGRSYRSADPTAIEIAARFHGFTVTQLVNYTKNRSCKAKKKSATS
jgi:hypothetical protein